MLESLEWGDISTSRFLQELRSIAGDGALSIKFNLDGYSMARGTPQFTKGRLVGTIGPSLPNEPRHFVQGRHFAVLENLNPDGLFVRPKYGINYCAAVVDEVAGKVRLDLGNALPTSPSRGPVKNLGALSLVCNVSDAGGTRQVDLGNIDYHAADWYERTAGVVDLPTDRSLTAQEVADLRAHPLDLTVARPSGQTIVAISEAASGVHVRADLCVARLNPGEEFAAEFLASRFGAGLGGARIALRHRTLDAGDGTEPPVGVPQTALTVAERIECDAHGRGIARLRALAPGNPRGVIDGQVYLVDYTLEGAAPLNPSDYLSVLVWDEFSPHEPPSWTGSMQAIFQQYGNLYPVMKQFLDMTSYEDVCANRLSLLQVLSLPQTDAHYMPVTRDLSAAKRAGMIRWLSNPGPDGKPLLQGAAGPAVRAARARARRHLAASPLEWNQPFQDTDARSFGSTASDRQWIDENLGTRVRLSEFRSTVVPLTSEERELLIDQAMLMLDQVYVHLPLKRAMHAIDPLQRLRLLKLRHPTLDERAFQSEMISIFVSLRDLHTNYVLPRGYTAKFAFLPFRIEECYEGGIRKFVVSWVSPVNEVATLKEGAVVTHWNGSPVELAVARNADREAGSNLEARRARGIDALTLRWLGMSLPPDEDWVTLNYTVDGQSFDARFDWQIIDTADQPELLAGLHDGATAAEAAANCGLDLKTHMLRTMRKMMFDPSAVEVEARMARYRGQVKADLAMGAATAPPPANVSQFPEVFPRFGEEETPSGRFGYIRLASFAPNSGDVDGAVREFARILKLVPSSGLILDIRANPGGYINFGERCLQMLTPRRITPEPFHFVISPLTLQITTNEFSQWRASVAQGIEIGSGFSQGFPLTDEPSCNDIGQVYTGPVVLIIDALCYSTSDIFAAGFQDHGIGTIIGTQKCTGAGGANVWTHAAVLERLTIKPSNPFCPLPQGAQMRVAARRSTRIGQRAGLVLEDLGVVPDKTYDMTANDVVEYNKDLIAYAASVLKNGRDHCPGSRRFDASEARRQFQWRSSTRSPP